MVREAVRSTCSIRLSVVIVVFNMQRAAPRSIQSLLPPYQHGISAADYEVVVVENSSTQALDEEQVLSLGNNIRYFYLQDAPSSPAYAINYGVNQSKGDISCIMVDGAHMLTPGVLAYGVGLFQSLVNPVVLTPRFFLGPGPQMQTILDGYDEAEEDRLLAAISWPDDGYRMFEIGVPYRIEPQGMRPKLFWFVRLFESNCLFMRKDAFYRVGACSEEFDIAGGGFLIPDLCRELADLEDTELVQLLGEASFHQLHGGTSTNTTAEDQSAKLQRYLQQYEAIRGKPYAVSQKPLQFYGHMPNRSTRELMISG